MPDVVNEDDKDNKSDENNINSITGNRMEIASLRPLRMISRNHHRQKADDKGTEEEVIPYS